MNWSFEALWSTLRSFSSDVDKNAAEQLAVLLFPSFA
jgi:hypothetical protein